MVVGERLARLSPLYNWAELPPIWRPELRPLRLLLLLTEAAAAAALEAKTLALLLPPLVTGIQRLLGGL